MKYEMLCVIYLVLKIQNVFYIEMSCTIIKCVNLPAFHPHMTLNRHNNHAAPYKAIYKCHSFDIS